MNTTWFMYCFSFLFFRAFQDFFFSHYTLFEAQLQALRVKIEKSFYLRQKFLDTAVEVSVCFNFILFILVPTSIERAINFTGNRCISFTLEKNFQRKKWFWPGMRVFSIVFYMFFEVYKL